MYQISRRQHEGEGCEDVWHEKEGHEVLLHNEGESHDGLWHNESEGHEGLWHKAGVGHEGLGQNERRATRVSGIMRRGDMIVYGTMRGRPHRSMA